MDKKQILIRTGNAVLAAILGLSPVAGASPLTLYAQEQTEEVFSAGTVTVDRVDGDNFHYLEGLGTAKYFTFSAVVTLSDFENSEQSAALICGGFKANVHGRNENAPIRIWRDDIDPNGGIISHDTVDLSQSFTLSVTVNPDGIVSYSVNGVEKCTWQVPANYEGGNFGLMTFNSGATFSDITLTKYAEAPEADRSELDALVQQCAGLKEEDHTAETWTTLQAALQRAELAQTQEEIDAALEVLQAAFDGLAPAETADAESLAALVKKAEGLKEEDYTAQSWQALDKALEQAAKAVSEEEIRAAIQALTAALDGLEKAETPAASVDPEDFRDIGTGGATVEDGALILGASGDHFAMLDSQKTPADDFHLEADVQLLEGQDDDPGLSAALVFGVESKSNPGVKWYGANVDSRRKGDNGFFRVFGAGSDILFGGLIDDVDLAKPLHLAVDVKADGTIVYQFGNTGSAMHEVSGKINGWQGGYVGLLTFRSKAAFTNVKFTDRTQAKDEETLTPDDNWNTDLGESVIQGGSWTTTQQGLVSDASGQGDTFLISRMTGENFIYETDLSYQGNEGAAGLLFRYAMTEDGKEGYAVNIDAGSHKAKFWRWQKNNALQLIDEAPVEPADTYHLKVVAVDGSIQYWINDVMIANLGDYTMQKGDLGQNTYLEEGYYGLLNWNAKAVFQNTKFTVLDKTNTPAVTDVEVGSHDGTVDKKAQFFPESPTWIQYVKNDAETVYLNAEKAEGSAVSFEKDGVIYQEGEDIPVAEGVNWITMTVTNKNASRTYRLDIHKFADDSVYYNEPYRGQYHYSVKEGWANDPNGLVYYNGKYHMFYQFYDDTVWGPMHWMHATSKDLVHWEEEPVAFYPDMNGTMFSGCIAVDENNSSGLFSTDKGGLIAFITVNGNGQRIKLAYSEDDGKTWQKSDKIAADWTNDPLLNGDFRDPKVFQWEDTWFMVLAGGPLRIYSSKDMVNWQCESAYSDLHTECPDLYPQEVDGQVKWILSRGGRYYKVGDLKQVDGKWTFVPDAYYQDKDGVMNFGKDSYAAMTYYAQSFGTSDNPTIPEIVELNWMNTWDNYCNLVADKVGQKFNGTFNLHLKVGLVNDNGVYRLTQTPIDAYQDLRDEGVKYSQTVGEDNTLLQDFQSSSYEIVSRFMPAEGTKKVGFKVRTGSNGEQTAIIYDLETDTISIDRSKSGIPISGKFSEVDSQDVKATRNADGSVDLHIFVDSSSVEVFANGYTAAGANQIFPLPTSRGAAVVVEGEACQADIAVYNLESAWTDKAESQASIASPDALDQTLYAGKTKQLTAYVLPVDKDQTILWSSSDPDVASVDDTGKVTAKSEGTATITAKSKADASLSLTFEVAVRPDNFNTNVENWAGDGTWTIEDDELVNDNVSQNAFWLSEATYEGDWTVSTDVKYQKGLVNIFFGSNTSPFDNGAYSVQLTQGSDLRLFRFAKDGVDEKSVPLPAALNDDKYHNIRIVKEGQTVTVFVDGIERLSYEYASVESHYQTGHVGVGLWDGKASFKNFMVTVPEEPEPAPADKQALSAEISKAGELNEADWTAESWKDLQTALEAAKAVLADEKADQDEVDAAAKALQEARTALKEAETPEMPEIDYEHEATVKALADVEITLDTAHGKDDFLAHELIPTEVELPMTDNTRRKFKVSWNVDEVEFGTPGTYTAYGTLDRDSGIMLLAEKAAPQAEIKATVNIREPEAKPADKTALKAAIEQAQALDETAYTAESWKALSAALKQAQAADEDAEADQAAVDKALQNLEDALKVLKPAERDPEPGDHSLAELIKALESAIARAEKLAQSGYTADSWSALSKALEQAKAVIAEGAKAKEAEVEAARSALESAIRQLKPVSHQTQNTGSTGTVKNPSKAPTAAFTGAAGLFTLAGASLAALLGISRRRRNRK